MLGCSQCDTASSHCCLCWCCCALQAQGVGGRPVKYSGMADVFRQTYSNEGLRGFYKVSGTPAAAGRVQQPPCLHLVEAWRCHGSSAQSVAWLFRSGFLLCRSAVVVAWCCAQSSGLFPPGLTLVRMSLLPVLQGLIPNLIKLAPAAGISWYVFEETKLLLGVDPRT